MKIRYKIIALSVGLGVFIWVIDAVLDSLIFYEGTFLESLIFDIPGHEIFMRTFILAYSTLFGVILSQIIEKRELNFRNTILLKSSILLRILSEPYMIILWHHRQW